jgi:mRNA-degrading endonuclease toxin of MazEF toxin-antitoxin module
MSPVFIPNRGDVVWLSFTPQVGHEQAGERPALVLSPEIYNRKSGLAVFCPITSRVKGYPFEAGQESRLACTKGATPLPPTRTRGPRSSWKATNAFRDELIRRLFSDLLI